MTSLSPTFEEVYPDAIENIYNQENIDDMITTLKSLKLQSWSQEYVNFCISIKEAIQTFEKNSDKKYIFIDESLKEYLEQNDLIRQMQEFNSESKVVSIKDWLEYQPEVKKSRTTLKNKFLKLFSKFNI